MSGTGEQWKPILSLEHLSFAEKEGKMSSWYGKETEEVERMNSRQSMFSLRFLPYS